MALSRELISEFIKVTNDEVEIKQETTVYGTIVEYEGSKYVRLDGSDLLTPISSTTDVEADERVTVMIKNHTAMVTGNISSPSARTEAVQDIGNRITEAEILIADKVSVTELDAVNARIENLVAEDVTINGKLTANEARIDDLEAENVTITGTLTAQDAKIESLETNKLSATDADIKYATIDNLNATNAQIHNLEADYGDFKVLTAETLEANNASIDNLETEKLSAEDAEIKYATITNLDAANAQIGSLEADYGEFKDLTTENFTATNASIANLEANKLSVTDADIKYANIDFSNIGKAAMEYLYAESGLIENVVIGDATITGNLVGVTIKGDLIEGGTVVADKLVIKGTDGLYYKLNTDGVTTETEQTDYNSLNGSIITAKSIAATKISVDDLVAFDATIGGFNITSSSIYSGVKTSVDNTTTGVYLDNTGQIAFGDTNKYVKFYKNSSGEYSLEISADNLLFGSSKTNVETALSEVQEEAEAAQTTADEAKADAATAQSGVNNLTTRVTSAETKISQNEESITLMATKTEVTEALGEYYTKTETDAAIQVSSDSITSSVSATYATQASLDSTNQNIDTVSSDLSNDLCDVMEQVNTKITSEDVTIQIQTAMSSGVNKVVTSTGYKFDEDGLTVNKTGSEMTTQITEDGMTVYKSGNAVLKANNAGVDAINLHATTYLIIGTNSRFEDFGDRTACFWIGS